MSDDDQRAAALPTGTRRPTKAELAWLSEAGRWATNVVRPDSAWVTENEFRVIRLPGRELWMTRAEWQYLVDAIRRGELR